MLFEGNEADEVKERSGRGRTWVKGEEGWKARNNIEDCEEGRSDREKKGR